MLGKSGFDHGQMAFFPASISTWPYGSKRQHNGAKKQLSMMFWQPSSFLA